MPCTPTISQPTSAMQSLGDHVSLQAVATVLDSVRYHGSSGIGFTDFIDIMSRDSQDLREGGHNKTNGNATTAYNIALMARAYRYIVHIPFQVLALAKYLSALATHSNSQSALELAMIHSS